MVSLKTCDDREGWDDYVLDSGGHPLQLWGWGETKAAHGWEPVRLLAYDLDNKVIGAAQVLIKSVAWPFKSFAYVPRGPLIEAGQAQDFLEAIANYVRSQYGSVVLTIEPDWVELRTLPKGWRTGKHPILNSTTLILDLKKSEGSLLSGVTKKTRQHILKTGDNEALSLRQVKTKEGVQACLNLYRESEKHDKVPDDKYFLDIFEQMDEAAPLFAVFKDEWPIAFTWLAVSPSIAFELYSASNTEGRELHADYALKWYAVRKMKEWGIKRYDMNGLEDDDASTFKRKFADHEDRLVGSFDKPLSPAYKLWGGVKK